MTEPLRYELRDGVALLTMDDGKANALGHEMLGALSEALNRAEREASAVVIAGRAGRFSAGFDLRVMTSGTEEARALVTEGAKLLLRVYGLGLPVVAACTGHAMAAGALLLLAADTRLGADGDFKLGLNEVSLGMLTPLFGRELARARLDPRRLTESLLQGRIYSPAEAVEVGYLDAVAPAEGLLGEALARAGRLAALPRAAYASTKAAVRDASLRLIRDTLADDMSRLQLPTK